MTPILVKHTTMGNVNGTIIPQNNGRLIFSYYILNNVNKNYDLSISFSYSKSDFCLIQLFYLVPDMLQYDVHIRELSNK